MKRIALTAALCVIVAGSAFSGDAGKLDPAKIVGTWNYTEGIKGGTALDKTHLEGDVKVDKTKFVMPGGPGNKDFVMAYKIDATKTPAAIDFTIDDGPIPDAVGSKAKGIVSIDGDTMKICYSPDGDRPTAFESKEGGNLHLFTLKRAK
jgi:uncharacterized protein (TIGR03067 family)